MRSVWQVTEREHQLPLLAALAWRIPTAPAGFLRKCCSKGRIRRGAVILTAEMLVYAGDTLDVSVSQRMAEILAASPLLPQQVLHEDRFALVVDKPAGWLTHPADAPGGSLQEKAQNYVEARGEAYRIAPIHRLDRGTSGPVLLGKGKLATGRLGQLFMQGMVDKQYLALVTGQPPQNGVLSSPAPSHGKIKTAEAHFRRLAQSGEFCLLELQLVTGRTQQLRRQLAAAGWPILGDRRYRGKPWPGLAHPFLHCTRLAFLSLEDSTQRIIRSPLPEDRFNLLAETGLGHALPRAGQ